MLLIIITHHFCYLVYASKCCFPKFREKITDKEEATSLRSLSVSLPDSTPRSLYLGIIAIQ